MKLAKLIEFLRNRLKTVVWICCGVLALLVVVLDAIPAMVDKEHAHTAAGTLAGLLGRLRLCRLRADHPRSPNGSATSAS